MYDPEFNLKIESQMQALRANTEKIRESLGSASPLYQIHLDLDQLLEIVQQRNDDYDNCFDPDEKEKIAEDIRHKVRELRSTIKLF